MSSDLVNILTGVYPVNEAVLSQLPLNSLIQLCSVRTDLVPYCKESSFIWRQRAEQEFPLEIEEKEEEQSWKSYYIYLVKNTIPINVYLDNKILNTIKVLTNSKLERIKSILASINNYHHIVYTDSQNNVIGYSILSLGENPNIPLTYSFWQSIADIFKPIVDIRNIYVYTGAIEANYRPTTLGVKYGFNESLYHELYRLSEATYAIRTLARGRYYMFNHNPMRIGDVREWNFLIKKLLQEMLPQTS